jgi:hypothetical protein
MMMWFNHYVWFAFNNLEVFFPSTHFPPLRGKYYAFGTWLSIVKKPNVIALIAFTFI